MQSKHKRVILLTVFAVLFLTVLFFLKNKTVFKKEIEPQQGLVYGNETVESLVNKDTDLDTIPDWEESLWGTSPLKKDTNDDGVADNVEIEKLKAQQNGDFRGEPSGTGSAEAETLTETDKFAREFFSTVATLNQNGEIDQSTVDQISDSLVDHIKNSPPQKVFLISELKISSDNSLQAIKSYNDSLDAIYKKYPVKGNALDILRRFVVNVDDVDVTVLTELGPISDQTSKIINELVRTTVPQSFATLHLDFINGLEKMVENLNDIRLYEIDSIIALSAISQYEANMTDLDSANIKLANAIKQKLSN